MAQKIKGRFTRDVRIIARIFNTVARVDKLQQKVLHDIVALDRHYRNKIAAHKAHTTMAKKSKTPSAETLQMMLELVDVKDIPLALIKTWSVKERDEVARWAAAIHLAAGDHNIKIPDIPDVVKHARGIA